jgi:V/A-type H+-transporting ATPase subunit A
LAQGAQHAHPAVDPVESYSKYLEYPEVQNHLQEHVSSQWVGMIGEVKDILIKGNEVRDQINILGDDGVPLDYHVQFWKAEVIDFVILQQDAFDQIDAMTPIERQRYMLNLVMDLNKMTFSFDHFEEVSDYFKRVINQLKQMNYTEFESDDFVKAKEDFEQIIAEKRVM